MDQMDTHNNKRLSGMMDKNTTTRAGRTRWTHTQQGPDGPDGPTHNNKGRTGQMDTHTHNNQGRTDQMDTHTTRAGWTRWTHTQQQGPDGPDGPTHNNKGRMGQMDTLKNQMDMSKDKKPAGETKRF